MTSREDGFTLIEMLVASTVMVLILSAVMTAFNHAMIINDVGAQMSDSDQNLRAGSNLLIKDLLQAGRVIGVGGIPIPSGAGSAAINRPGPPATAYTFDNVAATTLPCIITGSNLGPVISGGATDMITMIMVDPLMPAANLAAGDVAADGASMVVGSVSIWLTGDLPNGIRPVQAGDLVWFNSAGGAVQTVTSTDATTVYFAAGDWFNFNQTGAAAGSIMGLQVAGTFPQMSAYRLNMVTYYVDAVTLPATPRLTRVLNNYPPQALAGAVEDLGLSYDLVDGVTNPTRVPSLPAVIAGNNYSSNQIRMVNLHMGVRADMMSVRTKNFVRDHVSTAISIRDLASLNRYQ
jgi:prepilin-type N-terminal cleavage/methylation domain-containing protein